MRCYLITCNGYKLIREVIVNDFNELIALCRAAEIEANDNFAVFAQHNSKIVADAEGICSEWKPDPVYQSGLMYACGYHD